MRLFRFFSLLFRIVTLLLSYAKGHVILWWLRTSTIFKIHLGYWQVKTRLRFRSALYWLTGF